MKRMTATGLIVLLPALVVGSALAYTYTWEPGGNSWWGETGRWSGGTDSYPDGDGDIAAKNNDFLGGTNLCYLADGTGADTSYTISGWSVSSPTSSNRVLYVRSVAGGSAKLTLVDSSDDLVAFTAYTGTSGNAVQFEVGLLLQDNMSISTSSSGTSASAWAFFAPITESGGSYSLSLSGETTDCIIRFDAANGYSGGTTIESSRLWTTGGAVLGTGDVTVAVAGDNSKAGMLAIDASVTGSVIDDGAGLYIESYNGSVYGVVDLGDGVDETVAALYFDGVPQAAGTWGATGSGAQHIDDNFFSGTGILTVIPEPTTMGLLAVGAAALLRRRRS